MTFDEFFKAAPSADYVICRQCQQQHYLGKGLGPQRLGPRQSYRHIAFVNECSECEMRLHNWYHHFIWWLTDCRPQGTWDAAGALAEAVRRDANCIALPTYEETETYLKARGFCVDTLPAAWAEWQQYRETAR